MESSSRTMSPWQAATLSSILGFIISSSHLGLTRRLRSLLQPWVVARVAADVPLILRLQKLQNAPLDKLFTVVSCLVSVPFYTGFLPLLFWSGHCRLARQMTLLIAFCDYVGNAIKDVVSAPRPGTPPVRRVTETEDEKENAMEYGMPSSHALNTVCLSGYLLHYVLTDGVERDAVTILIGFCAVFLMVALIAIGRIYLGMHSLIDVGAGIGIGLVILAFWLRVHRIVDDFVVSGQSVTSFWASTSFLMCFAYPTPEFPTPSFEYHTAFNGVAFGIVSGVQQTYLQFHTEDAPRIFSPQLPLLVFLGRVLVGIPTILAVKLCGKALAKWSLPIVCNTLGIPIRSSCYISALKEADCSKSIRDEKVTASFFPHKTYNIDTGIRFFQYAGLAWSVVDLVPSLFTRLKL